MWERLILFWNTELWNFRLDELTGWKKRWYQGLRILSLSFAGFYKDGCALRASSLTYYTIMSIVPILALALSIAKGFDLQEPLKAQLLEGFQEHALALNELIEFANKLIEESKGGVLAGIGVSILLWSAISLIGSMEAALNHIWEVHRMRSWRKIISEYSALMVIAPILFVIANSTVVFVSTYLERLFLELSIGPFLIGLLHISLHLVPYIFFWLFFSFLFYFLPNTKVKVFSAFFGGVIAGTLYLIAQIGYIYFQFGLSRYGAIYGSFAALPLFLIWVQLSWFIFLFGAEVSYAYQSQHLHEFEEASNNASPKLKKLVSLWLLREVVLRFQTNHEPTTLLSLIQGCKIPIGLALPLLKELVSSNLLTEVKSEETSYLPGRPLETLKIFDALQALECHGTAELPFIHSKELALFEKALRSFAELIEKSAENQLISSLKDCK